MRRVRGWRRGWRCCGPNEDRREHLMCDGRVEDAETALGGLVGSCWLVHCSRWATRVFGRAFQTYGSDIRATLSQRMWNDFGQTPGHAPRQAPANGRRMKYITRPLPPGLALSSALILPHRTLVPARLVLVVCDVEHTLTTGNRTPRISPPWRLYRTRTLSSSRSALCSQLSICSGTHSLHRQSPNLSPYRPQRARRAVVTRATSSPR